MTLEDLDLGPVRIGTVRLASGIGLIDRKVVLSNGFIYVETTVHEQTDVVAYPASQVQHIDGLKPGPSQHLAFGA